MAAWPCRVVDGSLGEEGEERGAGSPWRRRTMFNNSEVTVDDVVSAPSIHELMSGWPGTRDAVMELMWSEDHPRGQLRGAMWLTICNVTPDTIASAGVDYRELLARDAGTEHKFQRDLRRTFPNEVFAQELNVESRLLDLFNVLKAYSVFDPEVGYCQGMNFIVGLLLLHINDQEQVFWLFTRIMRLSGLRRLFMDTDPSLQWYLCRFEEELERVHPRLFSHMRLEGVAPFMYCTEWLTTLYIYNLPVDAAARVMDLYLIEGGLLLLLRVAVGLLGLHEKALLSERFDTLPGKLRHLMSNCTTEEMLDLAVNRTHLSEELCRPAWDLDELNPFCNRCHLPFGMLRWRHHCRSCGRIFCDSCSSSKMAMPWMGYATDVRVCNTCVQDGLEGQDWTIPGVVLREESLD